MSFPISPVDGQSYTNILGTQYLYVAANGAWKINSLLPTGAQGITGAIGLTGLRGLTGLSGTGVTGFQGVTGVANFTRGSTFPVAPSDRQLYWDVEDEIVYFYDTVSTAWIDISSGTLAETGIQGVTGVANSAQVYAQIALGI